MALVELKNVSLIYHSPEGETEALRDLNLTVNEREFLSIVGPSGCGKTTLLSILAGLMEPSSGEVLIDGSPVKEAKNKIALMPQRDQLFEWRNILRNVTLGPEVKRNKSKETQAYAEELLAKYGLAEFAKKRPSELSGGMRQRAALIRTLVLRPDILLLDEPFSALDFQTRLNVCDDVARIIKEEGKTAILVTHDINEAISMSDKVAVLSHRPATVKNVYRIDIDNTLSPLKRREQKSFPIYFHGIWRDMEVHHE